VIGLEIDKEKVVLILSGGMDSTTLLYELLAENKGVFAVSFDYGQKHKKELDYASKTCKKLKVNHKIFQLDVLNEIAPSALTREEWEVPEGHYTEENMKQTVVPNRNMIFLSLATAYAIDIGAAKVFYGAHAGDHEIYPDCRKEFVEAMQQAVLLCDWVQVELIAPYLDIDKGDIVIHGEELGVDYSLTWTCYKGMDKACGKCGSCTERLEAFEKAGIKDPIEYKDVL
jgi:7-cyano-7-deazaguanine synthase